MLLLSLGCLVTVNVLLLFVTVPWVGMQCVVVVFPDHTHLLFGLVDMINYLVILFQRMSIIVFEQKFNNCKRQSKQIYEFHFSIPPMHLTLK